MKLEKMGLFNRLGTVPRFGFVLMFAVAGLVACAATKTWNPTVSSGGSYKWSEAANWLEGGAATSAPANGDSLVFDSSSAAITAVNDCTGLELAGIAFSGSNAITLSGNKIDIAADGVLSAANAPITVTLALPMDVAGMTTFHVTTNGTTAGTTFELTGAIGGAGGIQTGGNNAGIYNFRAANTYAGMTYLTNGLGYHVYNGGAFGSTAAGTDYRTWQITPLKSDLVASPLYFHGVTTDEPFTIYGNQAKSLTFVANTTNILNGSVYSLDRGNVERWYVESKAKVVLNGPVDLTSTAQLNVSGSGELFFSNTVTMTRNPSTLRNNIDIGGTIHYAADMNIGSVFQLYAGRGVASLEKADIFGASGAKVSFRQSGTLRVSGGHQYFTRLFRASDAATSGTAIVSNAILTSADGTEIEITGTDVSENPGTFGGNVRLNLASGAKFKPIDQIIGCLMTNGVSVARFQSYGATGSGADVIDDTYFTGTGKLIVDGMQPKVWIGGAAGGSLDADANWSPSGVPYAGDTVTITGCTAGAIFTESLSLGAGGSLSVSDSSSVTFAGSISLQGSGNVTLDVADGVVAYFPGVISGPASAALITQGGGEMHFSGENTFDGNLTVKTRSFYVESNGAFGSTTGNTTLDRSTYPSIQTIYFAGTTNAEAIVVNGSGGQGNHCVFSGANIFNGAWTKTNEQFRFGIRDNSYTEFNQDFGDINYLTVAAVGNNVPGAVMVFNAAFTAGQPRLSGGATYIFTKQWTYWNTGNSAPRIPGYGFTYYLNGGTIRLDGDYLFNRDDKTPSLRFTGSSDAVIDLYGHDEEVGAVVGKGASGRPVVITSSTGPATLHVLNNVSDTYNSGVYGDKFSGELSVSVEGNSVKDALILAGVSDSTGTLIATNGGKVVMNAGAFWAGDVKVCDGSQIEIANASSALDNATHLVVETGGELKLTAGALSVDGLVLGGIEGIQGQTYGPVGSGADVESALLTGAGTIRVVQNVVAVTRTWAGPSGGTWSTAANWSPAGVPKSGDTLVFDSSSAAIDSVNDIAGLELGSIEFAGSNAIALSGTGVSFKLNTGLTATACSAEITIGLPLASPDGNGISITATAGASGGVTWNFTAPFTGAGDITFAGDNSATVNFRADSPAFDGKLYLVNAAAYHVWANGAFGSAAGETYYRVPSLNMERFASPLWLHGITSSENLVIGGNSSYSLCIADGTTNVLNGTVDGVSSGNDLNAVTERWWIGTNACVRFNGAVGCSSLAGTRQFHFIIFYGQSGSLVEINGPCNGGNMRQNMADSSGQLVINHQLDPATYYLGAWNYGTIRFGCDDVLYANPARPVQLQFNSTHPGQIDLAGHDQTFANVFPHAYMQYCVLTNSGEAATLTLMATNALNFYMAMAGDVGLCLASNVTFTLSGNLAATGPLTLTNNTTLAFVNSSRWIGTEVSVLDGSRLTLDATRLNDATELSISGGGKVVVAEGIRQALASLTLDGVAQTGSRSYGSSASVADVKDDAHFEGKGVVYVLGELSDTTRTWAGPSGGTWSTAANWSPVGVPQTGDTLVFDATTAAIDAVNDLGLVYVRDIQMRGANDIRLSGNALGLFDMGGISVAGGSATIELALQTRATSSNYAVDLKPADGATLTMLGAIGGDAAIAVGGAGKVEFKGANTFDGLLSVTNGEFHAYGNAVFGSTIGKTVFRAPSGVNCAYWFHDVSTDEAVEWYQNDGSYRGFFAANTTNAFNGTFTGLGGQPRVTLYSKAYVTFGNTVTNVGQFTFNTSSGSAVDVRAPFYCLQLRFAGSGSLFVRDTLFEEASQYGLAYGGSRQQIYLMQPDALCLADKNNLIERYGAAPLVLDNGMLDLCGNGQHAACFVGGSSVMVTNSGAAATLHVLQTIRGNSETKWTVALYGGTFNGVVAGPTSLSIEGNPNPVPSLFNYTDYLIATQRLTGVSTASGALIATNSAIVSLENGGRWAGTNVVVHANSKILLGSSTALAREADVFLEADGKLVLDEGVTQRCRYLYIDGVRQRRGTWGSGETGAPAVNVVDATHFEGKGVFRAMGVAGATLSFR